ncbi:MAG: inovirus Gp2 family protein [Desulfobacteraceae bacterium]|nr:MAG: inovirus Gp2 family protein [Desulfobacteraceae bacterium]
MNYQTKTNAPEFNNLPINTGTDGQYFCFEMMLHKIQERLFHMITKHNKVLFIRFDLTFPKNYFSDESNDKVSRLFKILKENATYKGIDLQFIWTREQSREKHQHYHCILLIDGNKVQSYYSVLKIVSKIWGRLLQCDPAGLVDYCDRKLEGESVPNGIMLRRPSKEADEFEYRDQENNLFAGIDRSFRWSSYLAKVKQKSNTPEGLRRFGVSQIK